MGRSLEYRIPPEDEGLTLEKILFRRLGLTVRQVRRSKFREDGICVNGQRSRVSTVLKAGDLVTVQIGDLAEKKEEQTVSRTDQGFSGEEQLNILFEDEDLLAVNKPAMVALHPAHGHYGDTLFDAVKNYYERQRMPITVRAVGRLDRETSGIVIFAKNAVAAARLFRAKQYRMPGEEAGTGSPLPDQGFLKYYLVLAEGSFEEEQFETDLPIQKAVSELNRMEAGDLPGGAKPARTCFRVLRRFPEGYTLLEALPVTGRTHQIRVHLSASGHPLLGDRIYGGRMDRGIERAALHCYKAVFCHPVTHKLMVLEAEPPDDFRNLIL